MDLLRQDLAFAVRASIRRPGFTFLAVSMLALGIGANTAIFSVVNAVVLRPLSYPASEDLFLLGSLRGGRIQAFSPAEFVALREQARGFEGVATAIDVSLNLVGDGEPERVAGARVTSNLLPLLRVEPSSGRNFLPEEEREGNDAVVLVSHECWLRRFGSDAKLLGRKLKLDGREREVAGILPEGFTLPLEDAELLIPVAFTEDELASPGGHFLPAFGRLAPGTAPQAATAEADGIVKRAVEGFTDHRGPHGATAMPILDFLIKDHRSGLMVLSASVGFVLLIACANVANLLLARATERHREIAVRGALGAGRGRLVRQLLTESFLLASLGGLSGVLLALWVVDLIVRMSPDVPRIGSVAVDWSVFAFAAGITTSAGLLFGLVPALEASRSQMERTLRQSSRSDSSGSLRSGSRRLLVGVEVALALVLLVGSGLTLRSFWKLGSESPGFVAEHLITARLVLPESRYADGSRQTEFAQRLLDETEALPGVRDAGLVAPLPLTGTRWRLSLEIPGREPPADGQPSGSNWRTVMPGYFHAMGIPLLAGRDFTRLDSRSDKPEPRSFLIVNETFARSFFPGEDPLGKQVRIGYDDLLCEIVGVVGDVRHADLATPSGEEMYTPFAATPVPNLNLAVRVAGDPESVAASLREAVRRVDPEQPLFGLTGMPELIHASVAPRRFVTFLLLAFAVVALVLSLLGIYAVVSHSVLSRTREIGIRMALGARASEVLSLVLIQALSLILAGASAGVLSSLYLSQFLESQLYGISRTDLATYAAVALFLVLVALGATAIPALRASRLDPIQALRNE